MNVLSIVSLALVFCFDFLVLGKQRKKIKELEDENIKLKQLLER